MRSLVVQMVGLACVLGWGTVAQAEGELWKVVVHGASVSDRKAPRGAPWDVGDPRPDPYAVVKIEGRIAHVSRRVQGTHTPLWFTGTSFAACNSNTRVEINVRDADVGKHLAKLGRLGLTLYPGISFMAKLPLKAILKEIDTDDDIGRWSGTLGQLRDACGGTGKAADVVQARGSAGRVLHNRGLKALRVSVVRKRASYSVYAPEAGRESYCGVRSASIKERKSDGRMWDVGVGAQHNPDARWVLYVNGEPVLASPKQMDSHEAVWGGDLPPLNLDPRDLIMIQVLDADLGTEFLGNLRRGAFHSGVVSRQAREALYRFADSTCTDDVVCAWVGNWASLCQASSRGGLRLRANTPGVVMDSGLKTALVSLKCKARVPSTVARMRIVVRGLEVSARKSNGRAWDAFRGKPDLFIVVSAQGERGGYEPIGTTHMTKDSLHVRAASEIEGKSLVPGSRVMFAVYDKDATSDDHVGSMSVVVPQRPGTKRLSGGQVDALVVEFAEAR